MRFCADSSLIVRLYAPGGTLAEIKTIEQYLAKGSKRISVSEFCRVEVVNVLFRHPGTAERFQQDLQEGMRFHLARVDWTETFRQAESLARRFSRILRPGGHDLVLVAAAVAMGATWFLSLDRNSYQRSLATAAGMRVWPPLDKDEKVLAKLAMRQAG